MTDKQNRIQLFSIDFRQSVSLLYSIESQKYLLFSILEAKVIRNQSTRTTNSLHGLPIFQLKIRCKQKSHVKLAALTLVGSRIEGIPQIIFIELLHFPFATVGRVLLIPRVEPPALYEPVLHVHLLALIDKVVEAAGLPGLPAVLVLLIHPREDLAVAGQNKLMGGPGSQAVLASGMQLSQEGLLADHLGVETSDWTGRGGLGVREAPALLVVHELNHPVFFTVELFLGHDVLFGHIVLPLKLVVLVAGAELEGLAVVGPAAAPAGHSQHSPAHTAQYCPNDHPRSAAVADACGVALAGGHAITAATAGGSAATACATATPGAPASAPAPAPSAPALGDCVRGQQQQEYKIYGGGFHRVVVQYGMNIQDEQGTIIL